MTKNQIDDDADLDFAIGYLETIEWSLNDLLLYSRFCQEECDHVRSQTAVILALLENVLEHLKNYRESNGRTKEGSQ